MPYRIVFFFLCWAIISIFYQLIQFLETAAGGEVDRMLIFISSFHLFTDSAKHPVGQHLYLSLAGPARRFSSPSASRGGRPVTTGTIGKQRPKMYFPISFSSPMSKHSNRSRKNEVVAIFTHDDFIIVSPQRSPLLKFDKTKKL